MAICREMVGNKVVWAQNMQDGIELQEVLGYNSNIAYNSPSTAIQQPRSFIDITWMLYSMLDRV